MYCPKCGKTVIETDVGYYVVYECTDCEWSGNDPEELVDGDI